MELILLIWGSVRNYLVAKQKNLSASAWAFYTFLSIVAGWFIGAMIVVFILLIKDRGLRSMMKSGQDQKEVVNYLQNKNLVIPEIFIFFCALGGYLYIRHMLNKKPLPPQ